MKKIILTCYCSLFAIGIALGQTVDGISIKDIDAEYIQIVGKPAALLSSKQTINIDFGQAAHSIGSKGHFVIKDEDGQPMIFNTMIDALNYMSKNGYQFAQAYVMRNGDLSECHYLMKKKGYDEKVQTVNSGVQPDLPSR